MPTIQLPEEYSAELLLYERFFRANMFRRINDLNKLWDRNDLVELPRGCFLHLIDDNILMNKPIVLVPDITSWSMTRMPDKKYVMHVTEPGYPSLMPQEERFSLPATGVTITILNFKKRNQLLMRPVNKLDEFPNDTRANTQNIISYNSFYRARIFGQMRGHRRMIYILTNLLNMIGSVGPQRKHFIPIPVGNRQFDRNKFMTSFVKHDKGTIKLPEDPWYLFMMHLMGFINSDSTPSLFEKIPKEYWENINFVLYTKTKMLVLNLKILKELNGAHNTIIWRVLKLINLMAEQGQEQALMDYADSEIVHDTKEDETELIVDVDTPFQEKETINVLLKEDPSKAQQQNQETPEEGTSNTEQQVTPPVKEPEKPKPTPVQSMFTHRVIRPAIEPMVTKQKMTDEARKIEQYLDFEPELLQIDPKWLEVEVVEGKQNAPMFTGNVSEQEQKKTNKELIEEIDEAANTQIENAQELSEAQANQAAELANVYKGIKIGEQTIQQIIESVPDDQVSSNELDFLKDDPDIVDKSMLKSSINTFENDYMKKMFTRDLVMNLSSFNKQGMFLKGIESVDVSDSLNQLVEYKATYEDIHKKIHVIRFKLPKVDERGYCFINGTLSVLKKQRVPLPICKINATTVTLNSDYNKYLISRNQTVAHSFVSYIESILNKGNVNGRVTTHLNTKVWALLTLPYEYTALAKKYQSIHINGDEDLIFYFNLDERHDWFRDVIGVTLEDLDTIKAIESDTKSVAFLALGKRHVGFINVNNEVNVMNLDDHTISDSNTIIDILCDYLKVTPTPLSEWTDFKLLDNSVPTIFALCYRYGLSHMLNYTNTQFRVIEAGARTYRKWSDVVIKFADKTLIIPRTPLVNSLLFAGLNFFQLNKINLEEMDSKDIYYDLLQSKKRSIHYLKGIDNFFDLFVDPITREVLIQMKEPTAAKDLLIRATQLLSTEDHKPQSSSTNFRFRSYERMNSAIYKVLSRSFANYRNKSVGATHKWSIADYEIQQLIMQDQLKENVDIINPINDIKYQGEYSHAGFGGRASIDSFVVPDRQYPADGVGIISEATVDSSKTAFAASTSMDPTIVNMRGMTISEDPSTLDPTQVLSVSALVMPGVTQDDGKRQNFVSIHLSHYLPTEKGEVSRLRTGYEKIIAHRTRPPFAYAAEADGVIEAIDTEAKILRVKYKDKTVAVSYGDEYTKNGGGGFYCTQNIVINDFKPGDKVKRGDIIIYNDRFFTPDPYSKQVNWNIGVLRDVVLMDSDATLDDSCIIDAALAKDLAFNPVHIRDIIVTKKTTIHRYAAIGTVVKSIDPLMIFDQSELNSDMFGGLDDEAIRLLGKINKRTPKAKFSGTVVALDAFYIGSIQEMAPGVRGLVNLVNKAKYTKNQAAKGAVNQDSYPPSQNIKQSNRIGMVDLDEETVIFRFYIQQDMKMGGGDKIEFNSSLKSVCTGVVEQGWLSEDGTITGHALFSAIGIDNRIINSPKIEGITNKVLETAEEQILKMYFDE